MTWQESLTLWEKDRKYPMTHPDVDTSYAIDRLNQGRLFLKKSKIDVKNKNVLDVAVGCGGILAAFAEKGARCYGLDVNDYFLKITRQRFRDMGLYCELNKWKGSGFEIPFPPRYFDFIICTDTLHHAPNWKHLVKEMCRVLKVDGGLFISEERRWFPTFIMKSPHDNLPLTTLMPSPLRAYIERRIGLPYLQYYMFSFSFEIKNEFARYGTILKDIDYLKRDAFEKRDFPEWLWSFYNLMFMQFVGKKNWDLKVARKEGF